MEGDRLEVDPQASRKLVRRESWGILVIEGGREDRESEGRKEGSTNRFWDVTFVLHPWRN